jgi:PRTRC genetic system protein C
MADETEKIEPPKEPPAPETSAVAAAPVAPEAAKGRVFIYDDRKFDDPGPEYSIEEVRKSLEAFYPELANAKTEEKKLPDGRLQVTFVKKAGGKGGITPRCIFEKLKDLTPFVPGGKILPEIVRSNFTLGSLRAREKEIETEVEKIAKTYKANITMKGRLLCIRPISSRKFLAGF